MCTVYYLFWSPQLLCNILTKHELNSTDATNTQQLMTTQSICAICSLEDLPPYGAHAVTTICRRKAAELHLATLMSLSRGGAGWRLVARYMNICLRVQVNDAVRFYCCPGCRFGLMAARSAWNIRASVAFISSINAICFVSCLVAVIVVFRLLRLLYLSLNI